MPFKFNLTEIEIQNVFPEKNFEDIQLKEFFCNQTEISNCVVFLYRICMKSSEAEILFNISVQINCHC